MSFRASNQSDSYFREMLVYIDRKRTTPDSPKGEYVYRMNMGIEDGLAAGIPQGYFDRNLRRFIKAEADDGAEVVGKQQALNFKDED